MSITFLGRATARNDLGGKASSLDSMIKAGLPVPRAFALKAADLAGARSGKSEAEAAVALLIKKYFRRSARFAVRSSSTAEDSAGASFAGQHDTFLGVTREKTFEAIVLCAASLNNERAVAYRDHMGIGADSMTVIVQEMIDAEVSAVVFTRHPISHSTDEIFINLTLGLGEPLVSGEITPDTATASRSPISVTSYEPGPKEFSLHMAPNGETTRREGPSPERAVSDVEVVSLTEMALLAEAHFGHYVDIEAAYADGKWWLLQARPITA